MIVAFAGGFSKGSGGGEKVIKNDKVVGYSLLGQSFTNPEYFWGRPSAVDYNAAGSAGLNKGPSNPEYLQKVSDRIDTLLKYNPGMTRSDIPADMITASGSGLDPDISVQGARMQAKRIAAARNLDIAQVEHLIARNTAGPLLGLFGPFRVNVLQLNLALDELNKR